MRQRPVRSGGDGRPDRMMWVVRSDEGGDGRTKMGTNPDRVLQPPLKLNDNWGDVRQAGLLDEVLEPVDICVGGLVGLLEVCVAF